MTTKDQYANRLIVGGRDMGLWDGWKGGAGGSQETKYNQAGTGKPRTLGGRKTVDNVTVSRLFEGAQGLADLRFLMSVRGNPVTGRATAIRQPTDADDNPFGDPLVYNGIVMTVTPGDTDVNTSGADVYDVLISTEGDIG